MKTRGRTHFFDSEIPKYETSVRSLEAEVTSLNSLSLSSNTLDAARNLMSDLQFASSNLDNLRRQLEALRESGEVSSNFSIGSRFPIWVDRVEDLTRRVKDGIITVQTTISSAQQQAPVFNTKSSKGLYGNHSRTADIITGIIIFGSIFVIYKSSKK